MWGDGCVHWVHGKISFCVYLYQIIALYTLPVLQFCQLYPIKAEVKKVSASGIVTKIAVVVVQSLQFSSVAQSCPTLCNPKNCSTRGLPVCHQLPDFTQTHVHRVSGAIQPSHPLSSPSPPAPNPSQHQGLFQWVSSLREVAKVLGVSASASVLPVNTQDWSPLGWTGWISLHSKGLSRVFSNTTVQKHQFFGAQPSSQSNSHIHTRPLEKP